MSAVSFWVNVLVKLPEVTLMLSSCVCSALVAPTTWLSSAVLAVTPSSLFSSLRLLLRSLISDTDIAPSERGLPCDIKFAKSLALLICFPLHVRQPNAQHI